MILAVDFGKSCGHSSNMFTGINLDSCKSVCKNIYEIPGFLDTPQMSNPEMILFSIFSLKNKSCNKTFLSCFFKKLETLL